MSLEHLESLVLLGDLLRGQGLLVGGHRGRWWGLGCGDWRGRDHHRGREASGHAARGLDLMLLNLKYVINETPMEFYAKAISVRPQRYVVWSLLGFQATTLPVNIEFKLFDKPELPELCHSQRFSYTAPLTLDTEGGRSCEFLPRNEAFCWLSRPWNV